MSTKISITTIQLQAIDFAAWVHVNVRGDARQAIINYGDCLRIGAHPGHITRVEFEKAMSRLQCADYHTFRESCDLPHEREYLDDKIAVMVARLTKPEARL